MGLLDDALRPGAVLVVLPGDGADLLLREVVRQLAQALLLVGQREVDHVIRFSLTGRLTGQSILGCTKGTPSERRRVHPIASPARTGSSRAGATGATSRRGAQGGARPPLRAGPRGASGSRSGATERENEAMQDALRARDLRRRGRLGHRGGRGLAGVAAAPRTRSAAAGCRCATAATAPPPSRCGRGRAARARRRDPPDARGAQRAPAGPREPALDVDAELPALTAPAGAAADPALRAEVRELVVARNARRARRGQPPLDVEAEVERQLRDLGAL